MLRFCFILIQVVCFAALVQAQGTVQNPFAYYRLLDENLAGCGRLQEGEQYLYSKHLIEMYEGPGTNTPSLLIPGNKRVRVIQADKKNPGWAEVCFAGYSGWVQQNQLDSIAPKNYTEQYVVLQPFDAKTGFKNYQLKSSPTDNAPDIGSRDYILHFTVLSPQTVNGYYLVNQTLGKTGWVRKKYIVKTGETYIIDYNSEQFGEDFENIGINDTAFNNFNVSITIEHGLYQDTLQIYNGHRTWVIPPCDDEEKRCSVTIEALPYNQYFLVMVNGMYSYFYRTDFMPGSRYRYVYKVESKE